MSLSVKVDDSFPLDEKRNEKENKFENENAFDEQTEVALYISGQL